MNEVFGAKLFCKINDIFASFCWLWGFTRKSEINKKYPNMRFFIIFWSKFHIFGHFNQLNLKIICRRPTILTDIFIQSPHR